MKSFLANHKRGLLISLLVLVAAVIAVLTAFFCTQQIKDRHQAEAVPPGRVHNAGVFGESIQVHDSTQGEIVIDDYGADSIESSVTPTIGEGKRTADPETIWTDASAYTGNHTPIEQAQMADGSLGVLTIEKIGLSVNVYEGPDQMEDMSKGAAHFPHTSAWDGNVGISAHNINFDGTDGFFKNLYRLAEGDKITYRCELGERAYTVETAKTIDATDWSPLGHSDENRLTLITCISGKPEQRLCVQAVEQG